MFANGNGKAEMLKTQIKPFRESIVLQGAELGHCFPAFSLSREGVLIVRFCIIMLNLSLSPEAAFPPRAVYLDQLTTWVLLRMMFYTNRSPLIFFLQTHRSVLVFLLLAVDPLSVGRLASVQPPNRS